VFVTPSSKRCDALLEDLRIALGGDDAARVRAFPRHDTPPYDRFSPQPFVIAQRMDILYRWLASAGSTQAGPIAGDAAPVVVLPWTALAARVPSRAVVRARTIHVEVGQTLDRDRLVEMLVSAGYARMPLVEDRGELSVRGGILDIFPPQRERPIRVELVESIREFDPASQRSQGVLGYAVAAPPRELLFDRALVVNRAPAIHELAESQGADHKSVDELVDALLRGHLPPGAEALTPLLQPELESVCDFFAEDALIVIDDPAAGRGRIEAYAREAFDGFEAALDGGRVAVPVAELLLSPEEIAAALEVRRPVSLERFDVDDAAEGVERYAIRAYAHDELKRELLKARTSEAALRPLVERLERWCGERCRVVLAMHSPSSAERLRTLLDEYGFVTRAAGDARPIWRWSRPGQVEVRAARLSQGFELPLEHLTVVTEDEIFGPRERRRRRTGLREAAALEGLSQLALGDHVVHATHGIGIYRGLVTLDLGAAVGDFLRIEYQGADRLFLPIHRLNLIQRYIGSDGHVPRIDKLGGETWERAKRSVERSLRDMANELLAIHAAREVAEGHGYPPSDRMFEEFETSFPFDETADQLAAIEDVLDDLQKPKPMDRLVCGDVGYGKTEVAVRAAFKVVMDGKQVAVLVPTTVLAQQHEETIRARFEGYPVRIESFSRFRSPKESRAVLEGLLTGHIDIVIGTHRLLQKTVRFRDLGLLVVDEEHRFGVAHKERIKQLKKTVDVLTLTATPIPRTLQLAFSGVRDLSVISTPPVDRIAIRTQITRFSESLCREAVLREVRRGGQVFFVHNRVQTIESIAALLRRIVPEVKVIVAHGQLRERELEKRMFAFLHGEADVLLCTTIIESGLDIPRANTILINRADTMGLAQLYQLRGRVGRSRHRAYAYLLLPDALTADAERRLEAIQDLSELGSGFRLANMDLEIRGAGNLLGAEQSGHLAAVGYDTYMQMLEETIEEMRGNPREIEIDPEIRIPVHARLSEEYVPEVSQRLVLYKRLASARDDADVDRIRDELLDRYGTLPLEAGNLLEIIRVKILARRLGVLAVDVARGEFVLTASESSAIDPQRLVNLLTGAKSGARVSPDHKIFAPLPSEPSELFPAARQLLASLGPD
jgi:transcription-repair coupling factor (superfamily II helicase)